MLMINDVVKLAVGNLLEVIRYPSLTEFLLAQIWTQTRKTLLGAVGVLVVKGRLLFSLTTIRQLNFIPTQNGNLPLR